MLCDTKFHDIPEYIISLLDDFDFMTQELSKTSWSLSLEKK